MFKQFYVSMQRLKRITAALGLLVLTALIGSELLAQGTTAQQQQTQQQQTPAQQQKKPETPGEAGGPAGDIGPIAVPKKTEEEPPPDVPRPKATPTNTPTFSMSVDTSLVTVPVSVLTKDGTSCRA